MDSEPDLSQAFLLGHYGTRAGAVDLVEMIERDAAEEKQPIPRLTVEPDRQGGWNVWVWQ